VFFHNLANRFKMSKNFFSTIAFACSLNKLIVVN
jgi:hypothetical protein